MTMKDIRKQERNPISMEQTITPNTRLHYLYRDACNYKVFFDPVLPGPLTEEQYQAIRSCLYEGEYFIPSQIGLSDDRNQTYDPEIDHPWFELQYTEPTDAPPTVAHPTTEELVKAFLAAKDSWDEIATDMM